MDWLSQFVEKLFSVFPRLWLVDPDESGVRVTLGTRIKLTPPGWYVYWPIMQNCERIKVKSQVKDLRAQSVWSQDRVELVVSGAIQYSVRDARKAILECYDYDANIQALALGVIQKFAACRYSSAFKTSELEDEILRGLREASQGWGLKIERVYITDIGSTKNLRVMLQGIEDAK